MNAVAPPPPPVQTTPPAISEVLRRYWGFDTLRPLQLEAINASLNKQDSLVVMPTGGGKSLCYQVPPLVANRTDIVVSPLISLMKDQVDALTANGYPAAALHSGLSDEERRQVMSRMSTGEYRLLFVAPERLLTQSFLAIAERLNVRSFAIDEAHCISQWGHDFRPEYNKLALLKKRFPEASIHAYTATATPRVRADIIKNLGLEKTRLIIGRFDRPNLTYRVIPRTDPLQQIVSIVRRHKDEAVIVYCISRKDAEQLAEGLVSAGVRAKPYHAGLDPRQRARTQEEFSAEKIDVVVATVAFGMGIDRSNVRCVIHAAMPKSIEHYQQETGRAGRDGLEAECVLLYSPVDMRRWEFITQKSAEEGEERRKEAFAEMRSRFSPQDVEQQKALLQRFGEEERHAAAVNAAALELVRDVQNFCTSHDCRHAFLTRHFGQEYESENCGACDICTDQPEEVPDAARVTKQLLACVRDLKVNYGAAFVVEIVTGSRSAKVMKLREEQLSQHGVLKSFSKEKLRDFLNQLVHQNLLLRSPGDMPVLALTPLGRQALEGNVPLKLTTRTAADTTQVVSFDYDHGLFDHLRDLRKTIAAELDVAAFVVFSDVTLRELAAARPSSAEAFRGIRGVGDRKAADYGHRFVAAIVDYCSRGGLNMDNRIFYKTAPAPPPKVATSLPANVTREQAFKLFEAGTPVSDVSAELGRTVSTVLGYLEEYITAQKPPSVEAWVGPDNYRRIVEAAKRVPGSLLRPVFDELNGTVSYDEIRIVMRHAGLR